jgi:putative ATP-dependent endonuclease of OLD family
MEEYLRFIESAGDVRQVPAEYYRVDWLNFAGNHVTARGVPTAASLIDASAIRLYSGADYYLQQIITEHLSTVERVELAIGLRHAPRSTGEARHPSGGPVR